MAVWTNPAGLISLNGLGVHGLAGSTVSLKQGGKTQLWNSCRATKASAGPVVKVRNEIVGPSKSQGLSSSPPEDFLVRSPPFSTSVAGGGSSGKSNNASAIFSLHDERSVTSPLEDAVFGSSDLGPSPLQSIAQAFPESPYGGDFSLDMNSSVGAVGGSSEFDAIAVSVANMYRPRWVWFAKSIEQENMIIDRAINIAILGSATTLAVTKILTVDHDYWHGWTLLEIVQNAPVHNWFAYEELLQTHPVLAKMMISGTVYALGDWIAQCCEGKSALDFNRLRMFRSGLVGFCLHGSMSHFYYHFCEWLFPFQGWWVVPLKVGFDQTIWSGIWNSIYFITIGLLRMESPVSILKELRETFFPLLTAGWKLWPFAHVITYGFIPVEQRLLWVDTVEIVWVTILATMSNQKSEARIAEAEGAQVAVESTPTVLAVQEGLVDEIKS